MFEDNETEPKLHAQAAAMLGAVLDVLPRLEQVIGVEVPFRLELPEPTGGVQALPLVASIDAVTVESQQTVYTELKTAKRRWSEDQLAFDMQLTAYGMALRSKGGWRCAPW